MAKSYTKDVVVEAALMRFKSLGEEYLNRLRPMYNDFYDEKGKTLFRTYTSVTPDIMKEYFENKLK